MDISQFEDFVSSDHSSNSANSVLFLVFSTYLVSLLPDYECGNFVLMMIHAGEDLYTQALLSFDPAHFEILLQSRSPTAKIVLPPIPDEEENEEVLQSR